MKKQLKAFIQKRKIYIIVLVIGALAAIIGQYIGIINPSAHTLISLIVFTPIIYFIPLGILAFFVAVICRNVKRFWFPILAWLFLICGVCTIFMPGVFVESEDGGLFLYDEDIPKLEFYKKFNEFQ
jgi:hypothetical protein